MSWWMVVLLILSGICLGVLGVSLYFMWVFYFKDGSPLG